MRLAWIYWRDRTTGARGHGELIPRVTAMAWAEHEASLYPHIQHWVVELEGELLDATVHGEGEGEL